MKRCRALIIVVAVLIICTTAVYASVESHTMIPCQYYVNPLYTDVVTQPLLQSSGSRDSAESYCDTLEAAAEVLRVGLEAREGEITVGYATTDSYNDAWPQMVFDEALAHTGVSTQGDYLMWHYSRCLMGGSRYSQSGVNYITWTYTPEYLSNAQQEQELDTAVDSLLAQLAVYDASDYEKVCAVYDYICQNITYGYDGLETGDPMVYTAYAALVDGSAVCQGYASLFYRLMLELDVDTRVIAGIGNGGAHGWNIVELSGLYYNVDATWDAGEQEYQYFLTSDANFDDHVRNEEYATETFYSQYPMAQENYDPAQDTGDDSIVARGTCGENLTWSLDDEGTLTISGTGEMEDLAGTVRPWNDYVGLIKRVVIKSGVTTVGASAFHGCTNLKSVTIPDSVTSIGVFAFYHCTNLTGVTIPDSVTLIADGAFQDCSSLESVEIPGSARVIRQQAFTGCSGLRKVVLGEGIESIEGNAFSGCTNLNVLVLPASLEYTNIGAFDGCEKLHHILYAGTLEQSEEISYVQSTVFLKDLIWHMEATGTEITEKQLGNDCYTYCSVCNKYYEADGNEIAFNGWYLEGGKWYFYENGAAAKNTWRKDSKGWVYLGKDGAMLTNAWCTDSKGWCYVGADGYMVTNKWVEDSVGWCYVGADGYMVYNKWVEDSVGWCYVGADGYMVYNKWVEDSTGWCYVGADGYMVYNKWVEDSTGWCYVGTNGYMVTNKWVKDGGYWYWLNGNGYMVSNTSLRIGGKVYRFNASGVCTNP